MNSVISRPCRVFWQGWETTTTRLQQNGWEISAEQDYYRDMIRLAFRNKTMTLYALSSAISWVEARNDPIFHINHIASRIEVLNIADNLSLFEPIDAIPQYSQSIEDYKIFATPLTRTKELIVDPNDVNELLGRIIDLQKPNREKYIEGRTMSRQKFHAQILSVA